MAQILPSPELSVPAAPGSATACSSIAERAQAVLKCSPYLLLRRLVCECDQGVLTIRGEVPSYYLKQLALSLLVKLRTTGAVQHVSDQVEVRPFRGRDLSRAQLGNQLGPKPLRPRWQPSTPQTLQGVDTMLVLSRKLGQRIMIGKDVAVTVLDCRGDRVRLGISAPAQVTVHREEVFERAASAGPTRVESGPNALESPYLAEFA